jgi:WXG100 family type VII secretion target
MPQDGTNASTPQMAAFASRAGDAASQLQGVFSTLEGNLQTLEAKSQGRFASAFTQVKATVATESANMNNALHGIAADIGTAGQNYAAGDEAQQGFMDRVQSTVTGITQGLTGR